MPATAPAGAARGRRRRPVAELHDVAWGRYMRQLRQESQLQPAKQLKKVLFPVVARFFTQLIRSQPEQARFSCELNFLVAKFIATAGRLAYWVAEF
jgi:hypothetical protein